MLTLILFLIAPLAIYWLFNDCDLIRLISCILLVIFVVLLLSAFSTALSQDAFIEANKVQYETLIYLRDNLETNRAEIINQINQWNVDLAKRQAFRSSPWTDIFFFDVSMFDFIPLEPEL